MRWVSPWWLCKALFISGVVTFSDWLWRSGITDERWNDTIAVIASSVMTIFLLGFLWVIMMLVLDKDSYLRE